MAILKPEPVVPKGPLVRSPGQIAWAKLRQHPLAGYGAMVLVVLYVAMVFADFLAPYDFETQFRTKTWHRPSVVRWTHADGSLAWPYVYNTVRVKDEAFQAHYVEIAPENMEYLRAKLGSLLLEEPKENPIRFFVKGDPHKLLLCIPAERRLIGIDSPERSNRPALFLLGSDHLGRDMLSRLLYGARVSLTIGLMGAAITFTLGMLIGGISGYFRGWTDVSIQRLIEMIMLLPGFYIMLGLRAAIPPGVNQIAMYFAIVFILAFIGWAGLARTIRGYVLSISQNDYVVASRALGQGRFALIVRHVLPQTLSYVIASVTMAIPGYMLGESGLSFIGLGIQEPYASWGNMLQGARNVNDIKLHPWVLAPGFLIFITIVAFQFLGDGLRDAFDPRTVLRPKKESA
ncbi:MAG: ABC transporter permease [Candidatus Brocadiae bacterium]|nr:ABC transporter permease [Candidatus Brocadiia bacterium]